MKNDLAIRLGRTLEAILFTDVPMVINFPVANKIHTVFVHGLISGIRKVIYHEALEPHKYIFTINAGSCIWTTRAYAFKTVPRTGRVNRPFHEEYSAHNSSKGCKESNYICYPVFISLICNAEISKWNSDGKN